MIGFEIYATDWFLTFFQPFHIIQSSLGEKLERIIYQAYKIYLYK